MTLGGTLHQCEATAPARAPQPLAHRLPSLVPALAFIAGALVVIVLGRKALCPEGLLSASSTHQLTSRAPGHSVPAYLARYNSLHFNLTDAERRRGVWHVGSGLRLRPFADKLISGQPVKILAVGGSVTAGHGLNSSDAAYPTRFGEFLNATFPHPQTEVVNRAIGGSTSTSYSLCFNQLVPQDIHFDLVVLELSMNEEYWTSFGSGDRKSYEQLLRKLLRLPSRPAVVVLHYYAWWLAFEKHQGDLLNAGLFWGSAETQLGAFDQYYDLPSLSLRSAIYHKLRRGEGIFTVGNVEMRLPGFGPPDKGEVAAPGTVFYHDPVHPSEFGHRIMAELLMELTWQAVTEAARSSRGLGRAPLAAAAAGEGNSRGEGSVERQGGAAQQAGGQAGQDLGAADEGQEAEVEEESLPQPMVPGNLDIGPSTCFMEGDLAGAVAHRSGFAYVAHRPDAPTFEAQKWSWTGTAPGDWVDFEVDTREDTRASAPAGGSNVTVAIGYLKSYESMGNASVQCIAGCSCDEARLVGTWDIRATLVQSIALQATQHPKCRIRVTILPETSSGQHKISLTFLLVSPYAGWFMSQWLGKGPPPGA